MRLLLSLLLLALCLPAAASAQASDSTPATMAKELRQAVFALPKDDPAVAYARDLRLEGQLLIGGAAGLAGSMLGVALADTLGGRPGRRVGPALVGFSLGVALGMAVVGLPPLLDGQRFLAWYATHDRPPTRLARLKLLRRWRMASLGSRRIAAIIGAGFLGATTLVLGGVWASREATGQNGSGAAYDPTDAVVTGSFVLGLAGAIVAGALADQELRREKHSPHRLYARAPKAAVMLAPMPVVADGRVGVGVVGALALRF